MASINFITAHDGFTMRDLVSYNQKHNDANGEGGADGESNNRSWNCGVEGPTDDEEIMELRRRQHRNFLTTLFTSQGVPMLSHGDEFARTQNGNNNTYCQDNEISWANWDFDEEQRDLLRFTSELIELRLNHPVLHRRRFFAGASHHGGESPIGDIEWFTPDGEHMTEEEWQTAYARAVMLFLNGQAILEPDARGKRIVDDDFVIMVNASTEALEFVLPARAYGKEWKTVVDTHDPCRKGQFTYRERVKVESRSVLVLLNPWEEDLLAK